MNKKILVGVCAILSISLGGSMSAAHTQLPDDEEIIRKYSAPAWMEEALAEHTKFFEKITYECSVGDCKANYRHLVWKLDSLPGYYVKWSAFRVKGVELIRNCIKEYNLDRLTVPNKYLYHIPGKGRELKNENYWVIAEEEKLSKTLLVIDLEDAKQICILIRNTGFYDLHAYNIVRNQENKISVIDTDDQFNSTWGDCLGLRRIITSELFDLNTQFTEDALKHIIVQMAECYKPSQRSYSTKYHQILQSLSDNGSTRKRSWCKGGQPQTRAWDYVGFFKELFPEPAK